MQPLTGRTASSLLLNLTRASTTVYDNDVQTKQELHDALDELIPAGTQRRSTTRIIGHALIELGVVTKLECAWDDCIMESRAFEPYYACGTGQARNHAVISVDHVLSTRDGGSDLPDNIQFVHFGCNSAKGGRDARANPDVVQAHSDGMKRMWKDPDKRRARIESVTESQNRPEVKQRKSSAMAQYWDTLSPEDRSDRARRAWDTRRRNQEKDN